MTAPTPESTAESLADADFRQKRQIELMREALRRIAENGEQGLWPSSWMARHARETLVVTDGLA